jgi:transcriptional regulator with XRE-family HTH domain
MWAMNAYHYTECGLSNVFIHGLEPFIDDEGEAVVQIDAVNELHREIARGIIEHARGMSPEELRFLLTEVGLTQSELADLVRLDRQTIGRWERGETPIDPRAETIIRQHAIEVLALAHAGGIRALARRSVPTAATQPIEIEAVDRGYRLRSAAA